MALFRCIKPPGVAVRSSWPAYVLVAQTSQAPWHESRLFFTGLQVIEERYEMCELPVGVEVQTAQLPEDQFHFRVGFHELRLFRILQEDDILRIEDRIRSR